MEVALAPRLLGALGELPVVEPRAEAAGDGLMFLRAVVVAEDTKRLLDGLFAVEDLGVQSVRGFAGPLRAWRVLNQCRMIAPSRKISEAMSQFHCVANASG